MKLMKCYTTKGYCSYSKLFKQSLSVDIMAIFWQVILVLTKLQNLLVRNTYYQPSPRKNIEAQVKSCNVCLNSKAVRHKPYNDFLLFLILTNQWKNFLIDFVTALLILTNQKGKSYNFILVIINRLTKIVYYELIKVKKFLIG